MLFSISSFPQKIKTVDGEYTYVVPETVDLEKAKSIALERIKIQLIAEEFGTTVSQSNLHNIFTKLFCKSFGFEETREFATRTNK